MRPLSGTKRVCRGGEYIPIEGGNLVDLLYVKNLNLVLVNESIGFRLCLVPSR